jgi:acetylornithine deacetylase/succinyl-diaminopimelate desuccinylase-like protein
VITPEILLLRDYVRIDTSNAAGVSKGARWLAGLLAKNGIRPELIESAPGRLNVYARIRGKQRGGGLLLLNHIDVVPANAAEWTRPPFSGAIEVNQLWGRGALDMKSIALCQLFALADIQRSGRIPERDIAFLASGEEEQGSDQGVKWLLAHRPDLFEGIGYAVTEGGITEVVSERLVYFGIEVGTKQHVQTYLDAPGETAANDARIALEPFMTSSESPRVLPEVRRFFSDVAPSRIGMKPLLENIDRTIAEGQTWRLPFAYRELMQNTLHASAPWPEKVGWSMSVLMSNLPDEDPDARVQWLQAMVAPYGIHVRVERKEGPVPSSSTETPLFSILAAEAQTFYGVRSGSEVLYSSVSDCRFLRPRGIACYGVSPSLVELTQSLAIHHADERIRVDWFGNGIEYLRRVVDAWSRHT